MIKIDRLPFRLTDTTKTRGNNFTAINYFYKEKAKMKFIDYLMEIIKIINLQKTDQAIRITAG